MYTLPVKITQTLATSLARKVNSFPLMNTICYTKHSNKQYTCVVRIKKNLPAYTLSNSSTVTDSLLTALGPTIPAQFTMISSRSENSVNSANPCLTEASSDTSTLQPLAVCPAPCSSATNVFVFSSTTSKIITLAPCCTNILTTALPSPSAPPVTIAACPANSPSEDIVDHVIRVNRYTDVIVLVYNFYKPCYQ